MNCTKKVEIMADSQEQGAQSNVVKDCLKNLLSEIKTQWLVNHILSCNEDSYIEILGRLKYFEKVGLGTDDKQMEILALQILTRMAANTASRLFKQN